MRLAASARGLVAERLAACVNIIPGMRSIYHWEGELREDGEVVVVAKTRQSRVADVIAEVKRIHSYECPCVVALPIEDGEPGFLSWIAEQTEAFPVPS